MTETHENLLSIFDVLDILWDLINASNIFKHPKYSLVGSSVSGSIKSCDSSGQR